MTEKNTITLTDSDQRLLNQVRLLPKMDRGSQIRVRAKIDARRRESKEFDEAFGNLLSGYSEPVKRSRGESFLRTLKDVGDAMLHPVTAVKGKVGETLLKRRNKAPEILVHPHPTLSTRAEEWDFENGDKEELLTIVRELGAALRGVNYGDRLGMAAPQIGISKRVFVCQGAVCVNPSFELPKSGGEYEEVLEGCYSLPDKQIWKTSRAKRIFAKWKSVDGIEREYKLKGTDAVVFQHELDHLDGKCACDIGVLYTPEEHAKSAA